MLLTLGNQPLFGASLQIIELLAETWQVYKRMRISRLAFDPSTPDREAQKALQVRLC
ncbi:hypothetical protein [Bradyrhizobium betae]|uniref:hypothetical protein n=1 Tax=Bradyrhizobium betae TaxID=244734 RepID=UPI0013E99A53|nr:hypothetical protein [Bradyrhizobium betae]